jgi:hypothetical protein
MPTNDFKAFAIGGGANVETQSAWAAEPTLLSNGFTAGIAPSAKANKAWRQPSFAIAAIAQDMVTVLNEDVLDDGTLANFERQYWEAGLRDAYFIDIGSTNTILTANPTGLTFPAPKIGTKVRIKIANTNTSSTVNLNWMGTGNFPVTYSDASLPGVGDLPINGIADFVFDGAHWQFVSFSITALRGLGVLINVQQFTTSTRVSLAGNSGNSWIVTAWSGINYVKKSATSRLIAWLNATTYCAGVTAPSGINLTIGGSAFPAVASNNFSGTNTGASTLINIYSGLGAGSLAITLTYSRSDSVDWTDIFCPTNADNAYLATTNPASLIIGEIGI